MKILMTGGHGFLGKSIQKHSSFSEFAVPLSRNEANVMDLGSIKECIQRERPEVLFHLAGIRSGSEEDVLQVNVEGTRNVLAATEGQDIRVVLFGSSAQYGEGKNRGDLVESSEQVPINVYGRSKQAAEAIAPERVIALRIFNPFGPGQPEDFFFSNVARQMREVQKGEREWLDAGPLQSVRDFLDIRDLVRGLDRVVERGKPGDVFHFCSGKGRSLQECLTTIQELMGLQVLIREAAPSSKEIQFQQGSFQKAEAVLGWRPEIAFQQSLMDLLSENL